MTNPRFRAAYRALRPTAIGVVLGLTGAFFVTRVTESMLIGVTPTDPRTFASIALLSGLIVAAACWLPALRAAGLDPAATLREE